MVFHVYVLKCSDGSFYVGHTNHLGKALTSHHNKVDESCYTASRLPVELVFQQPFATTQGAIANKQLLSSWSQEKLQNFLNREQQLDSDVPIPKFVLTV